MLINLRNALMAGKRTPTAKDYVQSGLIAMWDGIENAGWGVHDASATTWKDLIGSMNMIINHGSWGDTSFICDNGNTCGAYNANPIDPITAEVLFRTKTSYDTATFQECHIIDFNAVKMLNVILNDTTQLGIGYSFYTATSPRRYVNTGHSFADVLSSVSINYKDNDYYYNAIAQTVGTQDATVGVPARLEINGRSSSFPSKCWDGEIYCIRLYSRALNADEIARNYAIDKARFNLP